MSLFGTLLTMNLTDLLQWLAAAGKTGTLCVERNRATKLIRVRTGRVIGATSDDPRQRLGQFLLSRGKITEEQLREGLVKKEESDRFLGHLLVEMGALIEEDLRAELRAKAEEIIYSLFDWTDGEFRFEELLDERDDIFPVDLRVDEVLLRGVKRYDDMAQIRQVLHSDGIVLRYTSKPPGPDIFGDTTSRKMYSAIDGDRSLAEILLHLRGTEYQVKLFFCELLRKGYVEIADEKDVTEPEASDALDSGVTSSSEDSHGHASPLAELVVDMLSDGAGAASTGFDLATATAVADGALAETTTFSDQLARATRLMAEGEIEAALEVLDALYQQKPSDDALRRLTAEAEAAFVGKAYRHYLPADQVPVLTRPVESLSAEALTPRECFLLSRVDGSWDVKSIVQVAPFREVDALRTLKRMREMGMIELHSVA